MLEPEACIGDEKCRNLPTAIVVDVGPPVLVESLARVGMLVEMRAVEGSESMRIVREVAGHPIEDEPDSGIMCGLHEAGEIVR